MQVFLCTEYINNGFVNWSTSGKRIGAGWQWGDSSTDRKAEANSGRIQGQAQLATNTEPAGRLHVPAQGRSDKKTGLPA